VPNSLRRSTQIHYRLPLIRQLDEQAPARMVHDRLQMGMTIDIDVTAQSVTAAVVATLAKGGAA
jgi:hypothetical protein